MIYFLYVKDRREKKNIILYNPDHKSVEIITSN